MSRSIVSTTLAYTGGYIFLVLLAVCLATGAFFSFFLSLKSRRARVYLRLASIGLCVHFGFLSLCRLLESFSFIDFERYR